jgi:A/G-specific adenine glycosylase
LGVDIEIDTPFGRYEHTYTHFKITLHAFVCHLLDETKPVAREHNSLQWAAPTELADYPMGKIDRKIANKLQNGENE